MKRVLLLAVVLSTSGCGYNTIQRLDERAQGFQAQIEVQMQRRADLVPNLVNTVKGYAAHEEAVFTNVANARAGLLGAVQSRDAEQMANANATMTGALGRLLVIAEAYPKLQADKSFMALQDELVGTENRVAVARADYNNAVNDYNAYIRKFPPVLTAKVISAKPRKYFTATAAANEVPTVDFSKGKAKTP